MVELRTPEVMSHDRLGHEMPASPVAVLEQLFREKASRSFFSQTILKTVATRR